MGFLPWEIRVAFPWESQLPQSCATQPTVHAGCFRVSIIHQTLTWTTGSLMCAQMLMRAIAPGGCTDSRKRVSTESWLGEKNPLPQRGIELVSVAWLTNWATSPSSLVVLFKFLSDWPAQVSMFFFFLDLHWGLLCYSWVFMWQVSLLWIKIVLAKCCGNSANFTYSLIGWVVWRLPLVFCWEMATFPLGKITIYNKKVQTNSSGFPWEVATFPLGKIPIYNRKFQTSYACAHSHYVSNEKDIYNLCFSL